MSTVLFIRIIDNAIVIEDANGVRGGDLSVRPGHSAWWVNATGYACHLTFHELALGGQPSYGRRVWPFSDADPGDRLNVPAGGWKGTFARPSGPQAARVKYDVTVTADKQLSLDPIIIIEN